MSRATARFRTVLVFAAYLFCVGSANAANDELAQVVRESIQEQWDSDTSPGENRIKELTLIKRGENKYRGLVEFEGPDGPETLIVKVMIDDDNLIWEVVD